MRAYSKILFIFVAVLMSACASPVKKVDYKNGMEMPEDAHPTPLKFNGVELLLPVGMDIGYEMVGKSYVFGRSFCTMPRYPVNRSALYKAIDRKFLKQSFHDVMEAGGYDVVGSLDVAFDIEDEEARAEYSIKGKIKDAHVDMCNNAPSNFFFAPVLRPGTKGELYLAIDWSVYDLLRRKVVYKKLTEGYTRRQYPNQEGMKLMFHDAFEMSVHNLGADEDFYNLVVNGIKPKKFGKKSKSEERFNSRPRKFDPLEEVVISSMPLSTQPFAQNAKEKSEVAVMIWKGGHGSGFFITKEGHILTNAHVVGDSQRIRIVTADRKHKLIAEVLRINKTRDVALLKLESMPGGLEITTLPIRTGWPSISEDVYAIGAPKDYNLQDTLTKGIVSAHRKGKKINGVRLDFIQADVDVHGGSSGGPLIDEDGNIVGISVIGLYPNVGSRGIGLNLFIPIEEALKTLDVQF